MDVMKRRLGLGDQTQETSETKPNSNKLMSTWYNMKYGKTLYALDASSTLTVNSPVWLLGVCYHRRMRQTLHSVNQVSMKIDFTQFLFSVTCLIFIVASVQHMHNVRNYRNVHTLTFTYLTKIS